MRGTKHENLKYFLRDILLVAGVLFSLFILLKLNPAFNASPLGETATASEAGFDAGPEGVGEEAGPAAEPGIGDEAAPDEDGGPSGGASADEGAGEAPEPGGDDSGPGAGGGSGGGGDAGPGAGSSGSGGESGLSELPSYEVASPSTPALPAPPVRAFRALEFESDGVVVTFYVPDGGGWTEYVRRATQSDGTVALPSPAPDPADYGMASFLGWYRSDSPLDYWDPAEQFDPDEVFTEDADFFAIFSEDWLVQFVDGYGKVVLYQLVPDGGYATAPTDAQLEASGFDYPGELYFNGRWELIDSPGTAFDFAATPVTQNLSLSAMLADTVTIYFETFGSAVEPIQVPRGTRVGDISPFPDVQDVTRQGYAPLHWSLVATDQASDDDTDQVSPDNSPDALDPDYIITGDTLIYLHWLAIPNGARYKIVYWVERPDMGLNFVPTPGNPSHYVYGDETALLTATAGQTVGGPGSGADIIVNTIPAPATYADDDPMRYAQWQSTEYTTVIVTVAGDNSTIVNVYCTLRTFSIAFDFPTGPDFKMSFDADRDGTPEIYTSATAHSVYNPTPNVYRAYFKFGDTIYLRWPHPETGATFYRTDPAYAAYTYQYQHYDPNGTVANGVIGSPGYLWVTPRVTAEASIMPSLSAIQSGITEYTLKGSFITSSAILFNARYWMPVLDPEPAGEAALPHRWSSISGVNRRYVMLPELSTVVIYTGNLIGKQVLGLSYPYLGSEFGWSQEGAIVSGLGYQNNVYQHLYYNRNNYTLSYDFRMHWPDGWSEWTETLPYRKPLDTYNVTLPDAPGYRFMGWYADAQCTLAFDFTQVMPAYNIVVYAKWESTDHIITFVDADGSALATDGSQLQGVAVGGQVNFNNLTIGGITYVVGFDDERGEFRGWDFIPVGAPLVGGLPDLSRKVLFPRDTRVYRDLTLYARWQTEGFTVTYHQQNGAVLEVDYGPGGDGYDLGVYAVVRNGSGLTVPSGTSFLGWRRDGTGPVYYAGSHNLRVSGNYDMYPLFGDQRNLQELYYISNLNGGGSGAGDDRDGDGIDDYAYLVLGGNNTVLATRYDVPGFENGHWILSGWNTRADGNGTHYALGQTILMPAATLRLYAEWVNPELVVEFAPGDHGTWIPALGTQFMIGGLYEGDATPAEPGPSVLTREPGYRFAGWAPAINPVVDGADVNPGTNVITYTAQWAFIDDLTVRFFDAYDNVILEYDNVAYGSGVEPPADPYFVGHYFTGWDNDYTYITEDRDIHPTYVRTYRVIYEDPQVTGGVWTDPAEYIAGDTVSVDFTLLPDEVLQWEFVGWVDYAGILYSEGGFTTLTMPSTDMHLYALWYEILYTVEYLPGEHGTWTMGSEPYTYANQHADAPMPAAPTGAQLTHDAGYRFIGWTPAVPTTLNPGDTWINNRTLSYLAEWELIDDLTVRFLDWDGTVLDTITDVVYGTGVTPPGDPTRAGYSFDGWDADYTNIIADIDIYATYVPTYTVTYEDPKGLIVPPVDPNAYRAGETATVIFDVPRDVNEFTFVGWERIDASGAVHSYPLGMSASFPVYGDATLYAVWQENFYIVMYQPGDKGTWDAVPSSPYWHAGLQAWTPTPDAPTDDLLTHVAGYRFVGWSPAINPVVDPADAIGTEIVYFAQWEFINDLTVRFLDWDGTVLSTITDVAYGSGVTPPGDPSRSGYLFTGWDADYTNITASIDIHAVYEQLYKVYYEDPLGLIANFEDPTWYRTGDTVSVTFGVTSPTQQYEFVGWMDPAGNIFRESGPTTFVMHFADTVLTAAWNEMYFTVQYLPGDHGTWTPPTAGVPYLFIGLRVGDPTPAAPTGDLLTHDPAYRFVGWSPEVQPTVEVADATNRYIGYTAQWELIDDLTVRFLDWDGTVLDTITDVVYGTGVTPPDDPTRAGYSFDGWDADYTNITADIDIYATYVPTYTVTYEDPDGRASAPVDPNAYRAGDTATVLYGMPNDVGEFSFKGWTLTGAAGVVYPVGTPASFTVTGDITLYAVWQENFYTVVYEPGDKGTWITSPSSPYWHAGLQAWTPTPAAPTDDLLTHVAGYRFVGWSPAINPTVDPADASGTEIVYTAQWEFINDLTVRFLDWDGTVLDTITDVAYGSGVTPPGDPSREGYLFTGWDADYTNITASIDIHAVYEQLYKVYYEDPLGLIADFEDPTWYRAGDTVSVTFGVTSPTQQYRFIGWSTSPTGAAAYRAGYTETFDIASGDVTLYAVWEEKYFTVEYLPGDHGTWSVPPAGVPYMFVHNRVGDPTPAAPTGDLLTHDPGYRFVGWSPEVQPTVEVADATNNYIGYTAQWELIDDLVVRFIDWDGTVLATITDVVYGTGVTAPTVPYRWGFEFTGWDRDYSYITEDTDVYAQYVQMHGVSYKEILGLATPPVDPDLHAAGSTVNVLFDMPASVNEYIFLGWSHSYGASTPDYAPGGPTTMVMPDEFVTLYSVWGVLSYDVAYAPGDHGTWTVGTTAPYYYTAVSAGTATPAPPNAAALTADAGYRLAGWSPAWNATVYPADAVGGVITYTAQWELIDGLTVRFLDFDGTVLSSQSVSYGSAATAPTDPTRSGYAFTGWSPDYTNITADVDIYAQ
ncbi:MAG: InlB B-repeat-containing protein, partial [Lachnospiraceae bacterium]|nr:InlB B-repeat-containing protein [Lachnospiraceae bacterium]